MSPLSKEQKRIISQAARAAYQAWDGREAYEAINSDQSRTKCFEAWRHVEQGKAVGIQSLCECTQAHYRRLQAHFIELAGDAASAANVRAQDQDNGRRIAFHKLNEALAAQDLKVGYAATICRTQFRCSLDEATEKQIWKLLFTVRNRAKSARHAPTARVTDPADDPF